MSRPLVLVVEDDAAVRAGVVDALAFAGYDTREAPDARSGLDQALRVNCDLVLLDLVLPGGDGLDILRAVRGARPTLPVIVLTARGAEDERVAGLQLGADDYVVKPFSVRELLARVDAVLRRSAERPTDVATVAIPGAVADLERGEIRFDDGAVVPLAEREAALLRYLATNAERVVSRDELLARVWRVNPRGVAETRTVDVHVARLRAKLRDDPAQPRVLLTVRQRGYLFRATAPRGDDA